MDVFTEQEMQEEMLMQQLQQQASMDEFQRQRSQLMMNPQPTTNYETAVFLLSNSELTKQISEIEKEIKLSNIDRDEKRVILSLLDTYQDQILLNNMQYDKYKRYLEENYSGANKSTLQKEHDKFMKEYNRTAFDKLNTLRKALSIATVSRGTGGFERQSQNTVIQNSNINQNDIQEIQKKGFFGKLFGGFS